MKPREWKRLKMGESEIGRARTVTTVVEINIFVVVSKMSIVCVSVCLCVCYIKLTWRIAINWNKVFAFKLTHHSMAFRISAPVYVYFFLFLFFFARSFTLTLIQSYSFFPYLTHSLSQPHTSVHFCYFVVSISMRTVFAIKKHKYINGVAA